MHCGSVRYGDMLYEWDDKGNLTVTRQSDGTRIYISPTEWIIMLKVMDLRGWPVAPPVIAHDVQG